LFPALLLPFSRDESEHWPKQLCRLLGLVTSNCIRLLNQATPSTNHLSASLYLSYTSTRPYHPILHPSTISTYQDANTLLRHSLALPSVFYFQQCRYNRRSFPFAVHTVSRRATQLTSTATNFSYVNYITTSTTPFYEPLTLRPGVSLSFNRCFLCERLGGSPVGWWVDVLGVKKGAHSVFVVLADASPTILFS
jgi:hypothetical protein